MENIGGYHMLRQAWFSEIFVSFVLGVYEHANIYSFLKYYFFMWILDKKKLWKPLIQTTSQELEFFSGITRD